MTDLTRARADAIVAGTDFGTVLVIDDEPTVGYVLTRILRGHTVTVVTTGREALELLRAGNAYDVILCDITMPGMSGIEVYRTIAAQSPDVAARIIFVTGGAFTTEVFTFLDEVVNERVDKPFDMSHIRALVSRYVASAAPRCA